MANKYVEQFIPFVDAIAETFGKNCEVVLHDLTKPHQSIIKIANGHVTGRHVGGPTTDLTLSLLEKQHEIKGDYLVNYKTKTKKGTELKSTTVIIRNNKGKIVGTLCINIDITLYTSAKNVIEQLCATSSLSLSHAIEENKSPEEFVSSVDSLINDLIEERVKKFGKPIAHMDKDDKLRMLRDLKEKGFFLIKGSAKRISKELNVSLATIYKYLEEI